MRAIKLSYIVGTVVILLFLFVPSVIAAPVYQTVASQTANPTYQHGLAVIDIPSAPQYGTVGIEWHYWKDSENYWHYSYRILNNGDKNTPSNYHFGWNISTDPSTAVGIDGLTIDLDPDNNTQGPSNLYRTDTTGGSSATGTGWADSTGSSNKDFTWGQRSDTKKINPTTWKWKNGQWNVTIGNTSGNNVVGGGKNYFQIASTWTQGLTGATVAAGSLTAYSDNLPVDGIMGPVVVPEPATVALLSLGTLVLISGRLGRRKIKDGKV